MNCGILSVHSEKGGRKHEGKNYGKAAERGFDWADPVRYICVRGLSAPAGPSYGYDG